MLITKQAVGTTRRGTLPKIPRERIFGSVPRDFGGSTPPKSPSRRAVAEKGFLQTRRKLAPFTKQAVGTPADFVIFVCAKITKTLKRSGVARTLARRAVAEKGFLQTRRKPAAPAERGGGRKQRIAEQKSERNAKNKRENANSPVSSR